MRKIRGVLNDNGINVIETTCIKRPERSHKVQRLCNVLIVRKSMRVVFSAMFKRAISQQGVLFASFRDMYKLSHGAISLPTCNIALSQCVNLMHILERRLIAISQYRYPSCLSRNCSRAPIIPVCAIRFTQRREYLVSRGRESWRKE